MQCSAIDSESIGFHSLNFLTLSWKPTPASLTLRSAEVEPAIFPLFPREITLMSFNSFRRAMGKYNECFCRRHRRLSPLRVLGECGGFRRLVPPLCRHRPTTNALKSFKTLPTETDKQYTSGKKGVFV